MKKEFDYDAFLHIHTTGRDDQLADEYNYPYEPTPYRVLKRIKESGLIQSKDIVVDFGCGKGRADFYFAKECNCKTIGVEYDERMYQQALDNVARAQEKNTNFYHCKAEEFVIPNDSTRFYFFNPFSVEILYTVLNHIQTSYYENPREILLFFYYPSDDYIAHLMTHDGFTFYDEIECEDLFEGNNIRERVMVFCVDL